MQAILQKAFMKLKMLGFFFKVPQSFPHWLMKELLGKSQISCFPYTSAKKCLTREKYLLAFKEKYNIRNSTDTDTV